MTLRRHGEPPSSNNQGHPAICFLLALDNALRELNPFPENNDLKRGHPATTGPRCGQPGALLAGSRWLWASHGIVDFVVKHL